MTDQRRETVEAPVGGPDGRAPLAARRAIARWAWRLFRREWRQQLLVTVLLTVAIGTAIFVASVAYNSTETPEGEWGSASHFLEVGVGGSDLEPLVAELEAAFGDVDVILRRGVTAPGWGGSLELVVQDPDGPYGGPMLELLDGRYPVTADEVAVTDDIAAALGAGPGDEAVLDDVERRVVGLVENPYRLDDEFVLAAPRSEPLSGPVPDGGDGPDRRVKVLVDGSADQVAAFREAHPEVFAEVRFERRELALAVGAYGVATVVLVFVALVAAAGFVVVAHRRLRQLGLLAAIGATERQLRLVVLANGALVGLAAATAGTVAALAAWVGATPALETYANRRLDRFDVAWVPIGLGVLLAVATALLAAWWPARTVARVPVTRALSGRPPRPRPAHRPSALAGVALLGGVAGLVTGGGDRPLLIVAGTALVALGVLLLCPLLIRLVAGTVGRLPISGRLAVRDLGRHQARSSVALAAISLALGISVAIAVLATAADAGAGPGNLSGRQLLVDIDDWNGPNVLALTPAEVRAFDVEVDLLVEDLSDPVVVPLDAVVDPEMEPVPSRAGDRLWRRAVHLGRGDDTEDDLLHVASPSVLRHYGITADDLAAGSDVFTTATGDVVLSNLQVVDGRDVFDEEAAADVTRLDASRTYTALPTSFLAPAALEERGWEPARLGWLVETSEPLTGEQVTNLRERAAASELTVQVRDSDREETLASLRTGATGVGAALALCVLAMTVGLIRSESASDLRTLAAVGASGRVRRTITASTAGVLALLGALAGTAGAYLAVIAGSADDLGRLGGVPVLHVGATLVGVPLVAAAVGWVVSGRRPSDQARTPLGG